MTHREKLNEEINESVSIQMNLILKDDLRLCYVLVESNYESDELMILERRKDQNDSICR